MTNLRSHSYTSLSREVGCLLSRVSIKSWIDSKRIPIEMRTGDRFLITEEAIRNLRTELEGLHERRCARLARNAPDAFRFKLDSMQRALDAHDRNDHARGVREPSPAVCDQDISSSSTYKTLSG